MRHVVKARLKGQMGQRFVAGIGRAQPLMGGFGAQGPDPVGRRCAMFGKGAVEVAARDANPGGDGIGGKRGVGEVAQRKAARALHGRIGRAVIGGAVIGRAVIGRAVIGRAGLCVHHMGEQAGQHVAHHLPRALGGRWAPQHRAQRRGQHARARVMAIKPSPASRQDLGLAARKIKRHRKHRHLIGAPRIELAGLIGVHQ